MAKEFLYGETVLYETDEVDENGRWCLTKLPPEPDVWVIDGVECLALRRVAEKTGIHEQLLRVREWKGTLASIRDGGRVFIALDVVKGLMLE